MSYDIQYSDAFKKSAKALAKKYPSLGQDLSEFIAELKDNPEMGTRLVGNMYKVRMKITSKGRGKSAGARVITCVLYKSEKILLAEIYDKSDYSSVDEDKILRNLRNEGFAL